MDQLLNVFEMNFVGLSGCASAETAAPDRQHGCTSRRYCNANEKRGNGGDRATSNTAMVLYTVSPGKVASSATVLHISSHIIGNC